MPAKTNPNVPTLLLLNVASRNASQAERNQLRVDVLGALGLTEDEAADQLGEHQAKQAEVSQDTEPMDTVADADAPKAAGAKA